MMETIKKLSSTGFLLDSGWKSCDKFKVLSQPLFFNLKVGDRIDSLKVNKKGYVTDFIVLTHNEEHEGGVHTITPLSPPSFPTPSVVKDDNPLGAFKLPSSSFSTQDKIVYGQCVNLAFQSFASQGVNLEFLDVKGFPKMIVKAFDLADKIHNEYLLRLK